MRWLESITYSKDMNLRKLQETVEDRGAWWGAVHGVAKSPTEQQLGTEQQHLLFDAIFLLRKVMTCIWSENVWMPSLISQNLLYPRCVTLCPNLSSMILSSCITYLDTVYTYSWIVYIQGCTMPVWSALRIFILGLSFPSNGSEKLVGREKSLQITNFLIKALRSW